MKMKFVLFALMVGSSANLFAQKLKLIEGTLIPLKGQTTLNIEFTYDSMIIGKDTPEKVFIQTKKDNWDRKEPGKGAEWEKGWFGNRAAFFEDMFRYQFSKAVGFTIGDPNSNYTIIIKTKRTEPGWNAGAVSQMPIIGGEAWIVSTAERNKIVAKISFENCRGNDRNGGDFEMGRRLQSAYLVTAKELGAFVKAKLSTP